MATGQAFGWFPQARFGLFMHWGVYSILDEGEWVMYAKKIPADEYAKLASQFSPAHFDADAWAGHAVEAGMRHAVLTSRHHDGFCLWDSQVSYFTSVKTAAERDYVNAWIPATGEKVPFEWRDGRVGITVPAKYPEPFGTVALRLG